MKTILALVTLLTLAAPALADVALPAEQPTQTAEVLTIGAGMMLALVNTGMIANGAPSYVVGGAGVGVGLAAIALTSAENPAYQSGLFASGTLAIASGLIAGGYRYQLNRNACVGPAWNHGGPALALVIDF